MIGSEKILVKCEEKPGSHPHCPHGPMLFFYKSFSEADGYFACSAFRNKKECIYYANFKELTDFQKEKRYPVDTCDYKNLRVKIKSVSPKFRNFCHTCKVPYINLEDKIHVGHDTFQGINDEKFLNPTSFLTPLNNDKVEAQYFFDEKSLEFLSTCLKNNKINKVVCIGVPRLHAYLETHNIAKSFLLDFDHRYFYFYDDTQFAWYNMCNNHFFDESQKNSFDAFLSSKNDENIGIFVDPPFGCRTEVIANSIKQITTRFRSINVNQKVPAIFWIYPYFCESYIQEIMPEMEMCDYKINYTNHQSYSNGSKGRKLGSPVRLFTNVPQDLIILPANEGYKYCQACVRWTAKENKHCVICRICPSKNGDTYRHCVDCRTCVKPNYIHCKSCRRCTQTEGHNCAEYQQNIRCWICQKVGHNEFHCTSLKRQRSKSFPNCCLICKENYNHNEKKCPNRCKYI